MQSLRQGLLDPDRDVRRCQLIAITLSLTFISAALTGKQRLRCPIPACCGGADGTAELSLCMHLVYDRSAVPQENG